MKSRVLIGAAVLVVALTSCTSGSGDRAATDDVVSSAEPTTAERGVRNLTPDVKLPHATAFVIAPTDDGILAIGSKTDRKNGTVWAYRYDDTAQELTKIAQPPFSPAAESMSGVWTGRELVVLAWLCRILPVDAERPCSTGSLMTTSYNGKANTWTELPDPPVPFVGTPIGWTGHEAVFAIDAHLEAFDPSTRAWHEIPGPEGAPPIGTRVCKTAGGLVAGWATSFAYLPNGATAWDPIAIPPPVKGADNATFFNPMCGDRSLLFTDPALDNTWLYDLDTRAWRATPHAPADMEITLPPRGVKFKIIFDYRAWTGREFLLDTSGQPYSHALALDPTTTTWRQVQPGPERATFDPNLMATAWRDGTAFGADLTFWSWTPPDFDGVIPPFPTPQTAPPNR